MIGRFDGRLAENFASVEWDHYLRADPREFLHRLETAAGDDVVPFSGAVPADVCRAFSSPRLGLNPQSNPRTQPNSCHVAGTFIPEPA